MKNSTKNIVLSLLCIALSTSCFGQYKTKKYVRKNKKAPTLFCENASVYARGLLVEEQRIFTGNSDGTLYYFNTEKETVQMLFHLDDFVEMRDIERSGDHIMGIQSGDNGKIVRISNGGETKIIQPEMWKGVFLDGMDFMGTQGFLMGDPVDGKFSLYHTNDGGLNWTRCEGSIEAKIGEAGFAASGTNVQILNDSTYIFVSGGSQSRYFKSTDNGKTWSDVVLPYYPGEGSGAFSIHFSSDSVGMIVGGDYTNPDLLLNASFYTDDAGESWFNPENPPRGYRSCVYETKGVYYTCGQNGIDFSTDGGKNWTPFADGNFFSLGSTETQLISTTTEGRIQLFDLFEK